MTRNRMLYPALVCLVLALALILYGSGRLG